MNIKVLFFGPVTDVTQCFEEVYQNIDNIKGLRNVLEKDYPGLRKLHYRWAVNQEIINGNSPLADGDEIALLPPFAGG